MGAVKWNRELQSTHYLFPVLFHDSGVGVNKQSCRYASTQSMAPWRPRSWEGISLFLVTSEPVLRWVDAYTSINRLVIWSLKLLMSCCVWSHFMTLEGLSWRHQADWEGSSPVQMKAGSIILEDDIKKCSNYKGNLFWKVPLPIWGYKHKMILTKQY